MITNYVIAKIIDPDHLVLVHHPEPDGAIMKFHDKANAEEVATEWYKEHPRYGYTVFEWTL